MARPRMARSKQAASIKSLREHVERQRLTLQSRALDAQGKLLESQLVDLGNWADPRGPYNDTDGFWLPVVAEQLPVNYDSRKKGELVQVYLTEWGLKAIRDACRRISSFNEFAIAGHDNRISYIVGSAIDYRVVPRKGLDRLSLAAALKWQRATQGVIDDFCEANDWTMLAQESVLRCDRDGETFLRFFPQQHGVTAVRLVEPEHIKSPPGHGQRQEHLFGIATDAEDLETRLGYWIWDDPSQPPDCLTPAEEVLHIKLNVTRGVKRGLPTWFPVQKNLRRAESLQQMMTTLVQIRASIAMIRKHSGVPVSAIEDFASGQSDLQVNNTVSGRVDNYKLYRPGTILDAPESTSYEFPGINANIGEAEVALKAELRAIAARLNMPEWMLTANASDMGAYTSSMVAESPSVKNFERLQAFFMAHFGAGRYKRFGHQGVMWRAIEGAVKVGRLPDIVVRLFEIEAEPPTVQVRNRLEESQRDIGYVGARIKSPQTVCQEQGWDYEREMAHIEEHEERMGSGGGSPLALPDDEPPRPLGSLESLLEVTDESGHEHKGKGPGGGQFMKKGGSGPGAKARRQARAKRKARAATADRTTSRRAQEVAEASRRLLGSAEIGLSRAQGWAQNAVKWMDHKFLAASRAARRLAVEVAKERGLGAGKAAYVGRCLAIWDTALQWTAQVPATEHVGHLLGLPGLAAVGLAKVSVAVPIASISYIAYSTARNPLATIRAAKNLIRGKKQTHMDRKLAGKKRVHEGVGEDHTRDLTAQLLHGFDQVGDHDWYEALLMAAFDETGNAADAIRLANQIMASSPAVPKEQQEEAD